MQLLYPITDRVNPTKPPYVTSWYGEPRSYGNHEGIDYAAYTGQPVYAAASGVVVQAYPTPGNHLYGIHTWLEHQGGYRTGYAHLSELQVVVGDWINAGQIIGLAGSTGNSTGPHLHFNFTLHGAYLDPNPYMSGNLPPTNIPPDASAFYRVTVNALNLRERPSVKAKSLGVYLRKGMMVYTTNIPNTADGYTWIQLASPQTVEGKEAGGWWFAMERVVISKTTYAVGTPL